MAPTKKQRSTKELGSSSQAGPRPQRTSRTSINACDRGNMLHPLGLVRPDHVLGTIV